MKERTYNLKKTRLMGPSIYQQMKRAVDGMKPEFAAIMHLYRSEDMTAFAREYAEVKNLSKDEAIDKLVGLAKNLTGRNTGKFWENTLRDN